MWEVGGGFVVDGPAELEDRSGAGAGAADVVGGEAGDGVDRGVVGAGGEEDVGRADEAGAVEDGAEGDVGGEEGDEGDAAEGDAASALPGAVAAGWRTEPAGWVEAGWPGREPGLEAPWCEWARGTVAAIATPPAMLAAVTDQVTADIRTSLRRASCSMKLSSHSE